MSFGRPKNRRRIDAAQRAAAMKDAASRVGAWLSRGLIACALLAALGWGAYAAYGWALTSRTFALRALSFHGLHHATEAELTRLSGLTPGQNLFQLDAALLARAMAAHPWVRSVEVRRQFPSTVTVWVSEHEPAGLVSLGDLYLLDREGEPFKRVQAGDVLDLPLVTGVDREAYVAEPRKVSERLRGALALAAAYEVSDRPAGPRLSEIRLEPDGTTVVSSRGVEVHLGEGEPAAELARLSRVAAELSRRGLTAEVIRLDNRVRPGWVTVTVGKR